MRIAVVGGGVVGLASALELRRAGADVVLLERDACGQGASAGNAGWLTPAFSAPLAAPGTVLRALRRMLSPNSPFVVRPRLEPAFLGWAWRFARSTRSRPYQRGMQALARFAERALDDFDRFSHQGVHFEMHAPGLLFLALDEHALDSYSQTVEELVELGYPAAVERLDGDTARAREPAIGPAVQAALFAPLERYVRPESLCSALLQALRDARAEVHEHEELTALRQTRSGWLVSTPRHEYEADKVVITAGAWTGRILRPLGERIPLEGAKGYSLTTTISGPEATHTLYFTEPRVAYTPFGGQVRLAGTLELAGLDPRLRRSRIELLHASAMRYLQGWQPTGAGEEWAGFRPLTPDGLPVIGAIPDRSGLFLATGHGMLGVTLAPTTAATLAPLVLGESDGADLADFSPARF